MLNVTGIEFKFKPIKYAPKYIYFIFSFYIYILFYLHLNLARISNNYHSSYTPVKYLISSTSNNKSDASLSKALLVAKHFQIQFWDSSPSVNIIRAPGSHTRVRGSLWLPYYWKVPREGLCRWGHCGAHSGQETKHHNERLQKSFSFCTGRTDRERGRNGYGKLEGGFRELRRTRPSGI